MLKRIIVTVSIAIGLTVGANANEAEAEKPIYAEALKRDPEGVATTLKVTKVKMDGQELPIVEDGQIIMSRLAIGLHGWAVTKGYLIEEAVKDPKVFQVAFVERHGEKFPVDQIKGMKLVVPAKVDRSKNTATAVAAAPAQAAVPAVSSPTAPVTAPAVVAEAPAPAVKPAPVAEDGGELATMAALRKEREAIEAKLKENREVAYKVAKLATEEQAKNFTTQKAMEKFVRETVAQFAPKKEDQEAVVEAVLKARDIDGQIKALDEKHSKRVDGIETDVTAIGDWQWWQNIAITVAVILAAVGLGFTAWNWRRTTKAAQAVEVVAERVEDVAEKAGVHGSDLFDKAELKLNLAMLPEGDMHTLELTLDGEVKSIAFEKVRDGKVKVYGIADQTQPVKVGNVVGVIYDAVKSGRVIGHKVAPVTDFKAAA